MDNLKGHSVKGYELINLIGSGGFGAVYQAHQSIIDREVAIKVILPHHANDPQFIRTFESEAHLIARLEHPFIVPLYDFWRDPEGAYLVMRYYQSGNLSQLIHQVGALDYETIARMLEQIASALDAAHAANIIHRDIKPANILLDTSGNAYLSDFGLAEDIGDGTESSDMVGSPAYISPEVIQNLQASPQSDLYSLGFILYEMLTGKYAFSEITPDSSIMSILDFHLNTTIPDNLELSDAINFVIQRATAKDPQDRYPNAMAMATAFRRAISDDGSEIPEIITVSSEYIVNPYKGLRAFDEADEFTFFGRDKLVKRLLQRLAEDSEANNFLALVGPSGSGKSSVVHAGLIPAIRRGELGESDEWFILDMVPGANPFSQLVASLRSIALDPLAGAERTLKAPADALMQMLPTVLPTSNDKLLLIIDQFEELFTQTEDIIIRRQFLDLLYTTLQSERFYLVIMLRADFYDRPMMHEGFGEIIQARTQVVLPLTSMELNNVITKPAEFAGLRIDTDLTAAIIADVQAEAVALPLLQYALTEVFERRNESHLTLECYQQIGGIAGALAHRADEIYNQLEDSLQDIARQIFLRFVTLGEGTEDTRRRAKRSELLSVVKDKEDLQAVLDAFGQARLLTFDNDEESREPTVEVGHEALIREWNRLRDWLDASRDDIRRQRILNATVRQWLDSHRDRSYLLRGTQLLQVEEWLETSSIELTETELSFVEESIGERQRIEEIEQKRLAHEALLEKRDRDRLNLMLLVFAIAAVVAGIASIFAFNQANLARQAQADAELNAQEAEVSRLEAEASQLESQQFAENSRSLALASAALREYSVGNTDLALILALGAVNVDDTLLDAPPELAYDALIDIAHAPGVMYEASVVNTPIEHLAVSPDGRFAVFGSGINANRYWDVPGPPPGGGGPAGNPPGGGPGGNPPPMPTPDAEGNIPFDLTIWDLQNRRTENLLVAHQAPITDVIFVTQADASALLISASDNGQVVLWDFETLTVVNELEISAGFVVLSGSEDGETLLVAANGRDEIAGTLALLDIANASIIAEYPVRDDLALARMTSDSQYIVGLHLNGDIVTWDAATGEEVMMTNTQVRVRPSSTDLLINPNNQMIAVNTGGDTIPLYDLLTGQSLGVVIPSAAGTHRATFNGDGTRIAAVSRDGVVTIWDVVGQYFVRDFTSLVSFPTGIVWESTNDLAIVPTVEGALRVYSLVEESVDLVDLIGTQHAYQTVWISDTEVILGYRRNDNDLVVWNLESNEERIIASIRARDFTLSLSPDNQVIAIAEIGEMGHIRLFNLEEGEISPCEFCQSTSPNPQAVFINSSPNRLAVSDGDAMSVWLIETQTELWRLPPLGAAVTDIVSSHDASLLVIALETGEVLIIDAETGNEVGRYQAGRGISEIAISPDNSLLALVALREESIEIIDWQIGAEIRVLEGHDLEIMSIAFLSDGSRLLSASRDTTVLLWDIHSGEILNRFVHDLIVFYVSLSPDETRILSTPEDNLIHVWQLEKLSLEDAIAWAYAHRVVRDYTEGECIRYNISIDCADVDEDDN